MTNTIDSKGNIELFLDMKEFVLKNKLESVIVSDSKEKCSLLIVHEIHHLSKPFTCDELEGKYVFRISNALHRSLQTMNDNKLEFMYGKDKKIMIYRK